MKKNNVIYILMFMFIWSGCTVYKDLTPPSFTPGSFRNGMGKDSSNTGEIPLKTFITDLTVQNLIDTALEKNSDLQIAIKNIAAAEVLFNQSRLGNLPELRLQVNASSSRPSDNSLNGLSLKQFTGSSRIEDYTASVGLVWEADIWGKIRSQKAAALAGFLQTEEVKKAVQTRLVAEVATAYYNLLMLDTQLEIGRKNAKLSDSTFRMVNLQFEAGQVTALAVQQAKAQYLNAEKLIPLIEQMTVIQENGLSVLIGILPQAIPRGTSLDKITAAKDLHAGLPSSMLSRRPDIQSASYALQVANAKAGVAKASLYPSLNITASGGINTFTASNWFNIPASLFGLAAGGITQPIFQRKQLKSNFETAKIEREKAVISFRQSILNAVGEVSDELVRIEKLKSQYDVVQQRTKTLQLASRNASNLFNRGMANYLEVIDAQGNLLQSELELASIKTQQLNAEIGLYRSLGGGWN